MTVDQPTNQETILLVENDALVRMSIARYLRDCGYKVIETENAHEARPVLLNKATIIDVVLSDIDMSIMMDGFGLANWLREQRPELEMIWAATLPRTVHAAKELCDDGPLPNPPEPQVVLDRIRHLLATRKTNGRKS
jgi:DNA-binding NtrC family response regulator